MISLKHHSLFVILEYRMEPFNSAACSRLLAALLPLPTPDLLSGRTSPVGKRCDSAVARLSAEVALQ